ncbi:MAG: 1-acyl-sn-glycerol-3-phosphate acyltransferase [Acidimicrobiia bacterium]|nr:1-acyl-sn-glycerol-3-phosphate acyltransferase [Acidimicrobiia bacterium]
MRDLADLTKAELLELARKADLKGRSKMTKAQLLEALEATESKKSPPENRRQILADRLAKLVDPDTRCRWQSVEGNPCGLPAAMGSTACVLHGGVDIEDLAVPVLGRLGFDTWPTLLRHMWLASYSIDPLGLDPIVAEMAWHAGNGLYFDYFRVEVEGIEHVPMAGPAIIAGNHGGAALPYDAAMLMITIMNEAPLPRRVRVVGTEIFNMLPFVSHLYRKAGAAFASREDALRILGDGHLLGVFPEGERGFMKPVWEAYQLQRFGRGGFVELAGQSGAPIVPVAIIGSEEVHPAVAVSKTLARVVRMVLPEQRVDGVAVWLNPIPLPVKWRIRFLPPVEAPADPDDSLAVLETTELVKGRIQAELDDMVSNRGSIF